MNSTPKASLATVLANRPPKISSSSPLSLSLPGAELEMFSSRNAFGINPNLSRIHSGFLGSLPPELLTHILSFLPLSDIGNLALASNSLRLFIADWLYSKACLDRIQELDEIRDLEEDPAASPSNVTRAALRHLSLPSQPAFRFALLCKRLTCLLATGDRIKFSFKAFHRILTYQTEKPRTRGRSKDWNATLFVAQYCGMVHTFTRGWDESEYDALIKVLDARFEIGKKLSGFLAQSNRDDVCVGTEMKLRLLLRSLTWDFAGKDYGHKAVWLMAILNRFVGQDPRSQALVFFLLFGPPCQDSSGHYDRSEELTTYQQVVMNEINNHTDWHCLVETVPENFHDGRTMYYILSQAICSCTMAVEAWRNSMMTKVLDELFTIPMAWKKDNIAGFLLFCSESLILDYLKSKLDRKTEKDFTAAAELLVHMITMSYKFDNDFVNSRGIGKIFDTICVYPEAGHYRTLFLHCVMRRMIAEIESPSLEVDEEEMLEVFESVGVFILNKAFDAEKKVGKEQVNVGGGREEDMETVDKVLDDEDVEMEE